MARPDKPNILFVFADQQRWDTCGCYGQPLPVTPNLDAMAAQGARWEHAFTPQPVCGPARAVLQTGLYASETGCFKNNIALPLDAVTVPKLLNQAGYQTAYVGKWHLASDDANDYKTRPVPPERRGGFADYWRAADVLEFTSHAYDGHVFDGEGNQLDFPEGRFRADVMTDHAVEFLQTCDADRPWFLMVSYIEPHQQNDLDRYTGPKDSNEKFADFTPPADLDESPNEGDWRANYPDYLGCCNAVDAGLGRLRQQIDAMGQTDNTLVIYTSDHGSHFRTRNAEYKRTCHDSSIHIPLVLSGWSVPTGHVLPQLASLIDVPPTIVQAAGLAVPEYMRGTSLLEMVSGEQLDVRQEVFIQVSEDHIGRALRTERWTYEVAMPSEKRWSGASQPASDFYVETHLYDNHADPHQLNNLVADPDLADIRDDLRGRLLQHIAQVEGATPRIEQAG